MADNVLIDASDADDCLRLVPERKDTRWDRRLVLFMRVISIVWLVKGLSSWLIIMGIWSPHAPFYTAPLGYQSTVIYFAVTDPVAAIGMWIATQWGGILWLLAIVTNAILAFSFPRIIPGGVVAPYVYIVLVICYLVLSTLAARKGA
ncbi:MAG: DUF6163 family protein [Methylobacteriaceae bacterium]|nr:DUF6163 family protein [Methylobacteriaceae bacterium]